MESWPTFWGNNNKQCNLFTHLKTQAKHFQQHFQREEDDEKQIGHLWKQYKAAKFY